MRLTMLHTAQVHCAAFDALRDRIAPGVALRHVVRPDWLDRAQAGISPTLGVEISEAIAATTDKVICTCTTIGPTAAKAGAIRIDQPMMQAAAKTGGPVLMAYCLNSTFEPSMVLLRSEMEAAGNPFAIHALPLSALWSLFEVENTTAFAQGIAKAVQKYTSDYNGLSCVVLAQASMAAAAPLVNDPCLPVLSSPELALRAALA